MTEEQTSILGIPDAVQHEGVHIRRNSTERFSIINGVKIVSRYRRPSLGSCHDFCKYGEERALEIKAKEPMLLSKGFTETLDGDHELETTETSAERRKKFTVRLQCFPVSKTLKVEPNINGVVSSSNKEEIILSEQVSPPLEEIELLVKHVDDIKMKKKSKPIPRRQSSLGVQRCSNDEREVKVRESKPMQPQQSSLGVQRSPNDGGEVKVRESKPIQPQQSFLEEHRSPNDGSEVKMRESEHMRQNQSSLQVQICSSDEEEVKMIESKPVQPQQSSLKVQRSSNDEGEAKVSESKPMEPQQSFLEVQRSANDESKVKVRENKHMPQNQSSLQVQICSSDEEEVKMIESKPVQPQQSSLKVQRSSNDEGEAKVSESKPMEPQQSFLEVQRSANDESKVKVRENKHMPQNQSSLQVQICLSDEEEVKMIESKPMQPQQSSLEVQRNSNDGEVKVRESKPMQPQQSSLEVQRSPNDESKVKEKESKHIRQNQSYVQVQICSSDEEEVKMIESKPMQPQKSSLEVQRSPNDERDAKMRECKLVRRKQSSLGVQRCSNDEEEVKMIVSKPMRQNHSSLGVQRCSSDVAEVKVRESKPIQRNVSSLRLQRCLNEEGEVKVKESKSMPRKQSSVGVHRSLNDKEAVKVQETKPIRKKQSSFRVHRYSNDEGEVKVKESKPMQQNQTSLKVQRCSNDKGGVKVRENKSMHRNQSSPGMQRSLNDEESREMGNLSMNSPGVSGSERRGKEKRSKEIRSSVKGDRKILAPASFPLSRKQSLKRVSSKIVESSNNDEGVSHLNNQQMVRKPRAKQSSNEDIPEKTLHVVEPNASNKTPKPIENGNHVVDLSSPSSSSPEVKSLKHAQIESFTAKSSTFSEMQKRRGNQNRIHATNSPLDYTASLRRNGSRVTQFGSHIAQSTFLKDECSPRKKLTFRRGKVVKPKDSTPSRLKFRQKVLDDSQIGKGKQGKEAVNTAQLSLLSIKQNLRRTGNNINSTQPWPPSPKKKGLTGTQFEVPLARSYITSLASMSVHSDASFGDDEIDAENQMLRLEEECKNKARKDRLVVLKDDDYPGQRLTSRREKVVDPNLEDATPRRLKFRQRMLGDSNNDKGDTNTSELFLLNAKKNLRCTRVGIHCSQLRQSWPPSPTKRGSRDAQLGNPITRSYPASLASLSTHNDASSEHDETDIEKQISDLEKELKSSHDEEGTNSLKEECDQSQKLTFNRGKKVDLNPVDSSKKLKFKQSERIPSDSNQKSKKILGKEEIDDGKVNGAKTETKNVALRHKGEENQNSLSLWNNMIEETASKLVKSRKSKVKALVGAFETVISLQDNKTSVTSHAY